AERAERTEDRTKHVAGHLKGCGLWRLDLDWEWLPFVRIGRRQVGWRTGIFVVGFDLALEFLHHIVGLGEKPRGMRLFEGRDFRVEVVLVLGQAFDQLHGLAGNQPTDDTDESEGNRDGGDYGHTTWQFPAHQLDDQRRQQ